MSGHHQRRRSPYSLAQLLCLMLIVFGFLTGFALGFELGLMPCPG